MTYFKFNILKLIRKNANLIIVLLIILLSLVGMFLNKNTMNSINPVNDTKDTIKSIKDDIETSKQFKDSEIEQALNNRLSDQENFIYLNGQKNWTEAYAAKVKLIELDISVAEQNSKSIPAELIQAMNRDKIIYTYLSKHNIEYQNTDFAFHATDFIIWTMTVVLPFVLTLSLIFILSQLFTSKYKNDFNTAKMLPSPANTKIFSEISVGIIFVLLTLTIILGTNFCISYVLNGMGSWNYPYPVFNETNITIIPFYNLFQQSLALQSLSLIFSVEIIYVIAMLTKNNMTTAFISVGTILGYQLLLNTIEPIQKIAEYIPFTYINSVAVVTKQLNKNIENYNINTTVGLLVTISSIIILLLIIVVINNLENKKKR